MHGQVGVNHHRVLDEDRVGMVVGGLHLDDLPAGAGEGVDVPSPLRAGQVEVDGHAVDVGDETLGEARTRATHERDRRRDGIRARHETGHSEW